jgi:hypothetical protein
MPERNKDPIEERTAQEGYPSTDNATYLQFRCNYCLKKFYLVYISSES